MAWQSYSVRTRHWIMGITQVTNITVYLWLKYVTGTGKANVDRDHHAVHQGAGQPGYTLPTIPAPLTLNTYACGQGASAGEITGAEMISLPSCTFDGTGCLTPSMDTER